MNSLIYDSIQDQEQSITNLIKIHSLTYLLEQDRIKLITESLSISYYHPNIDRDKAEQLLKIKYFNTKRDGLFLLRDCTTSPSSSHDLSLSIIYNDKCYHYKIQLIYDIYFCIDSGPQIVGIESLIRYYQERTDGLVCLLSNEFIQGQPPPISSRCIGLTNTLHRACKQGNYDIVKRILSSEYSIHCPDVNGKDSHGSTSLHLASYFGHDDIVRLLIKAGSHAYARDANGATPLHRAAAGNRPSTLLILINEGLADYEERNYTNCWVPLHEAAFHNSAACAQVLLDCGAPLRPRTDQGKTPLQLAEEMKSDEVMTVLNQYKTPRAKSCLFDWFHEPSKFDRLAAKQLIESVKDGPSNGMFVVRYSSKNLKNYALTLYYNKDIYNFEIVRLNEITYYIDDGPYFDSLEHLIDHYCRIADGLPTVLTCSINQYKEIIPSRIQPYLRSHINEKKIREHSMLFKYNFNQQKSVDENKSLNNRLKFPSSLNSSVTSLNSSPSHSRTSSTQDSPSLSTSSSNVSLASNSPSKQAAEENTFIDRRQIISGKIKPYIPNIHNTSDSIERQETYKLNLISPKQIHQTAKLGEGEFGEVYEGFYQENSEIIPVAIKVLKDYSYSAKQDFLREAEHMSKLNHHCICKLYGIVDSNENDMMMVIELLLFGSMLDYLWKYQLSISEYRLNLWASQIADGMKYMEYKGIVHRDLAARNILLQSTDQVKISDFGLSRCVDTDIYVQRSDSKIPVKWYAPEAISIGKFTSKSDVWSFGITLWEMFSYGATPYGDMSGSDVYYSLKHGKRLERPSHCPIIIYDIMVECWEWDERKRPTFHQLYQLLKNNFDSSQTKRKSLLIDDDVNHSTNDNEIKLQIKSTAHF